MATFPDLEDGRRSSRNCPRRLNENQVCNNGEGWLLSVTHLQLGGVWTTAGKSCLRRWLPKLTTSRTPSKLGKFWNNAIENALKDVRLAILLSMCSTDLEKELIAQQHLFPDYAQMKGHSVTLINSRTRGLALVMMGNLSDDDSNHHDGSDESV